MCFPLMLMKLYMLGKISNHSFCLHLDYKFLKSPQGKYWPEFTHIAYPDFCAHFKSCVKQNV